MANKTYYSRVPHSTFICSKGTITQFAGGSAVVEDARIQGEIEAAINAGGKTLMTEAQFKAGQAKPAVDQMAADAKAAAEKAANIKAPA